LKRKKNWKRRHKPDFLSLNHPQQRSYVIRTPRFRVPSTFPHIVTALW
jgi:hypothetical protein